MVISRYYRQYRSDHFNLGKERPVAK